MMDTDSVRVLKRLSEAQTAGKAILFGEGMADIEYPEVTWDQHGLIDTNEIVVVAHYQDQSFAIAGPSRLDYPVMADRIFGIDIADLQYSYELSVRLWAILQDTGIIQSY